MALALSMGKDLWQISGVGYAWVVYMSEWHVPLTGGKEFIHPNAVTMSLLNVRMFTSIFIVLRSHRASFPPSPLGSLVDRQDAKVIVAGQVDR